jgi:hypothetical protein
MIPRKSNIGGFMSLPISDVWHMAGALNQEILVTLAALPRHAVPLNSFVCG